MKVPKSVEKLDGALRVSPQTMFFHEGRDCRLIGVRTKINGVCRGLEMARQFRRCYFASPISAVTEMYPFPPAWIRSFETARIELRTEFEREICDPFIKQPVWL